jgi:hypothetical protein
MGSFVAENRRLLRFYWKAAYSFGWGLLLAAILLFLIFAVIILAVNGAAGERGWDGLNKSIYYLITGVLFNFTIPGLISLCISQMIRFILEAEYKGGWILRYGHCILYGSGIAILVQAILAAKVISQTTGLSSLMFLSSGAFSYIPTLAKVMILFGLGEIMRRILPIIDESRTLV